MGKPTDTMTGTKEYWHFTSTTLRDGSEIPEPGVTLKHEGEVIPCRSGFHASARAIDALEYAPGDIIHRVTLGGVIIPHGDPIDKYAASERTILWSADATETLRHFARLCALDVIHLWDAPQIVRDYLNTGDKELRAAAQDAARDASWDAARDASWAAARDAARAAARDVARDVARDAARAAARDVAWDAAWAAAWAAAQVAARDAQNTRLEKMLMELSR